MKSIPDVQVDKPTSGGMPSGGGGGSSKVWTISGRLLVRESEIDGDRHDRPLKGIEVKVSASDVTADGPWSDWGTVRTDADGDYTLRETNNGRTRFFRVQARLVSSDLEVNDSKIDDIASFDLLDLNWRTVWKSGVQLDGPAVPVGTRVFAAGSGQDLGNETFRRQALIWYVLRTTIDRLEAEDPWFAMNDKIAAIYPAHAIGGTSYANGLTRMIYLHQDQPDTHWHPDTAVHEFFHLWNYDHNQGTINWLGAVCSLRGSTPFDLTTHNFQENPNVAFAEGASGWAANALLHELWGTRLEKPFNRRYLAQKGLTTLEMVEKSDLGVESGLRLLQVGDSRGWWSHLFGTSESYPENRPDEDGEDGADHFEEVGVKQRLDQRAVPTGAHHLSLWDILRTFRASSGDGWDTDLQVGNVDYGIVRFIDRAVDIHELGDDVRIMLKRCLDPLATDEPYESLDKITA